MCINIKDNRFNSHNLFPDDSEESLNAGFNELFTYESEIIVQAVRDNFEKNRSIAFKNFFFISQKEEFDNACAYLSASRFCINQLAVQMTKKLTNHLEEILEEHGKSINECDETVA